MAEGGGRVLKKARRVACRLRTVAVESGNRIIDNRAFYKQVRPRFPALFTSIFKLQQFTTRSGKTGKSVKKVTKRAAARERERRATS